MDTGGVYFDRFMQAKGEGFKLLATAVDPYQHCNILVYYIGDDTRVGVVAEGITAWICHIGYSLFSLFNKDELAGLIAKVKSGETLNVEKPVAALARKKLVTLEAATQPVTGIRKRLPNAA